MATIRIKRGLKNNMPNASVGEPIWTTDTKELYIGDGESNTPIKIIGSGTFDHRELLYRTYANAHPATAVSYDNTISNLTATETNSAIDEVLTIALDVDGGVWG
jgi:hypothetical protein